MSIQKATLWLGIFVSIAQLIGVGTIVLTDAIPAPYIPLVKSWSLIVSTIGTVVLTALHGLGSTDSANLRSVEAMPDVKAIVPVTGATGAVAAAVEDESRPKVIDAEPAPPSGPGKAKSA